MEYKMTHIYDVMAVQHRHGGVQNPPDVKLFYDPDRDEAVKFIREYVKKNGFTIRVGKYQYSIGTVALVERGDNGEEVNRWEYCEIFDVFKNVPLEDAFKDGKN